VFTVQRASTGLHELEQSANTGRAGSGGSRAHNSDKARRSIHLVKACAQSLRSLDEVELTQRLTQLKESD
jgi:hypothetical protein